jgi:hypothetical protein
MTRTKTRTARQSLWLTTDEKERWSKKAAAAGLNMNEYIRSCVERRAIAPVPTGSQPSDDCGAGQDWRKSESAG